MNSSNTSHSNKQSPSSSFLRGMARSFGMSRRSSGRLARQIHSQSNTVALYNDWKQVGADLKTASQTYGQKSSDNSAR